MHVNDTIAIFKSHENIICVILKWQFMRQQNSYFCLLLNKVVNWNATWKQPKMIPQNTEANTKLAKYTRYIEIWFIFRPMLINKKHINHVLRW